MLLAAVLCLIIAPVLFSVIERSSVRRSLCDIRTLYHIWCQKWDQPADSSICRVSHVHKSYRVSTSEGDAGEQSASVGLSEILKVLVEDRQRLEREHAEDRRRHKEQMELMRCLVDELRRPVPEPKADVAALLKLMKLMEQDDIKAYREVPQTSTGFSPLSCYMAGMYEVPWMC